MVEKGMKRHERVKEEGAGEEARLQVDCHMGGSTIFLRDHTRKHLEWTRAVAMPYPALSQLSGSERQPWAPPALRLMVVPSPGPP